MQISPELDRILHQKLPIDEDETILAVYKHHWFIYASSWFIGVMVVLLVVILAIVFTSGDVDGSLAPYKAQIFAAVGVFSVLVLGATTIPVYLRAQEHLVLTDEALLQTLQPSLFASKTDQLSLQHMADVSVKQDFFGTIFGYGHLTVETPGEQDNYEFAALANPHRAAREIMHAHENFTAALMGGHMPTTLDKLHQQQYFNQHAAGDPTGGFGPYGAPTTTSPPTADPPTIDPVQYQQFLQYQQMLAQQQAQARAQSDGQQQQQPYSDQQQGGNSYWPPQQQQ